MPRNILVLLQNAWSYHYTWVESGWKDAEAFHRRQVIWSRRSWLAAFHASRSGQRWAKVLQPTIEGVAWYFDNTTPRITADASGVHPPDLDYVAELFAGRTLVGCVPDVVVACGKQAGAVATEMWGGRLMILPHPAYRMLSDSLMIRAREMVIADEFDRCELVQLKGDIAVKPVGRLLGLGVA